MRRRRQDEGEEPGSTVDDSGDEVLPCNRCSQPLTFLGDRDFH